MQYKNLAELIRESNSTRKYFLSQPVWLQIELHNFNEYIHSAQQLHYSVDILIQQRNMP